MLPLGNRGLKLDKVSSNVKLQRIHMTESEEEYAFYYEIGFALMQWSMVEAGLQGVAIRCVDRGASSILIAIGFRAIENFRSKLAYVHHLFEHRYGRVENLLKRWKKLHQHCSTLSTKRNEIVHLQATRQLGATPGKRIALIEG